MGPQPLSQSLTPQEFHNELRLSVDKTP